MTSPRLIPSIDALVTRPALVRAAATHGRESVTRAARHAADEMRAGLKRPDAPTAGDEDAIAAWIERRTLEMLAARLTPSLRPVINATGVIIHTNLGRAPLAREAIARASEIAAGYSNLEYDLPAGERGHRHVHAERLLRELTGAESALVANNNAAATLLVLASLASGREVLVSRGELVEIGGGFRIPDVLAQSGAALREVGTTNRTRVTDYAAAISDRTALILRVHPSNFRIEGFTERPSLGELAELARRFTLPLFEDLGSGWLDGDAAIPAMAGEPTIRASLGDGADLVAFSGDKLLGGPQAGIVLGRADLIDRVRRHPLMRAVRADKLTYAALEATLALWADPPARANIPVMRMLTMTAAEIERRARGLLDRLTGVPGVRAAVIGGQSTTGGGSAPGSAMQTTLVAISVDGVTAAALDTRLRAGDPPIVARIQDDRVVLDARTIAPEEDAKVIAAIERAAIQS